MSALPALYAGFTLLCGAMAAFDAWRKMRPISKPFVIAALFNVAGLAYLWIKAERGMLLEPD